MVAKAMPTMNKIVVKILCLLSVLLAAVQTLLIYFYYEPETYLYAYGTFFSDIFNMILAAFVIITFVLFLVLRSDEYPDTLGQSTKGNMVVSAICGFAAAVSSVYLISSQIIARQELLFTATRQDNFFLVAGVVGIIGFLYFILNAVAPCYMTGVRGMLGCVLVIWHVIYLLAIYFGMTSPLNDPIRIMSEFALVGGMMYLVVEIRMYLGIPKKGVYVGVSIIAFTLLLISSSSNISNMCLGILEVDENIFLCIYQLVFALYILSRIKAYMRHKEEIPAVEEESENLEIGEQSNG